MKAIFLSSSTPTTRTRSPRRRTPQELTIVRVGTELRLAWRRGFEAALAAEPNNLVPYRLYRRAGQAMQEVAAGRLKLFNRK
jgi:fructose-bisphosphate aldolase class II